MPRVYPTVPLPTLSGIREACERFDRESEGYESARAELLRAFPLNTSLPQVLVKVVTLNRLYSTQILAVYEMARHIAEELGNVDAAMASGSTEIVDRIADLKVGPDRSIHFFSFATKFCSWHHPDKYPIQDSRVDKYLTALNRQHPFTDFGHDDRWHYPKFLEVMTALRDEFHLQEFSFKDIDKFIWMNGELNGQDPIEVASE